MMAWQKIKKEMNAKLSKMTIKEKLAYFKKGREKFDKLYQETNGCKPEYVSKDESKKSEA